jgi:anti-sigma factor RsiW
MTELDNNRPSDELLVAFMDGELDAAERDRVEEILNNDPVVAKRLEFLSRSNLPFAEAFEPVLAAAPDAALTALLAAVPSKEQPRPAVAVMGRRRVMAALAACLVAGVAVDRTVLGIGHRLARPDEASDWRAAVAEYLALYTGDTLAGPDEDHAQQVAQLSAVGEKLGLKLTPEAIAMPDVDFKRAQVLNYDGKPLAQIAYLDPEDAPMALCIIPSTRGAAAPDVENRKGMNVVYWSNATHAFMLIGHSPIDRLKTLADGVRGSLAV